MPELQVVRIRQQRASAAAASLQSSATAATEHAASGASSRTEPVITNALPASEDGGEGGIPAEPSGWQDEALDPEALGMPQPQPEGLAEAGGPGWEGAAEGWLSGDDLDLALGDPSDPQHPAEAGGGSQGPGADGAPYLEQLPAAGAGQDGWEAGDELQLEPVDASRQAEAPNGALQQPSSSPRLAEAGDGSAEQVAEGGSTRAERQSAGAEEEEMAAEESMWEVSALHGCWAALLRSQLAAGFAPAVLRTIDEAGHSLLTPAEAQQLTHAAEAAGPPASPNAQAAVGHPLRPVIGRLRLMFWS